MKVTIMNPDDLKDLYKLHGEVAAVCYDSDPSKAEAIGRHCSSSGHMSGSRHIYICFHIEGVDRGTTEQALRHTAGCYVSPAYQDNYAYANEMERWIDINPNNMMMNVRSFRYCDETQFEYYIPSTISSDEEATKIYCDTMRAINEARTKIKQNMIGRGIKDGQARQDANFLLPRATLTQFNIAFTPEALIHFCEKRLCTRAQEPIRAMAKAMKEAVAEINPRFAEELQPYCEHHLYCPEGRQTCGKAPTKDKVRAILQKNKEEA